MLSLLILTALFSSGLSAEDPIHKALENSFNGMDVNQNGNLEQAEFLGAISKSYDANHDNKVVLAEFLIVWNHGFVNQDAAGRSVFAQLDTNSDGAWVTAETTAAYKGMDSDGNGNVSKAEYIDFAAKALKKANFVITPPDVVG